MKAHTWLSTQPSMWFHECICYLILKAMHHLHSNPSQPVKSNLIWHNLLSDWNVMKIKKYKKVTEIQLYHWARVVTDIHTSLALSSCRKISKYSIFCLFCVDYVIEQFSLKYSLLFNQTISNALGFGIISSTL